MPNQILNFAFKIFGLIAPGSFSDPEKAYAKAVKSMGWIVIDKVPKIEVAQLKTLKELDTFEGLNLVQIKRLIEGNSPKLGPETAFLAKRIMIPELRKIGLKVHFQKLTNEEREIEMDSVSLKSRTSESR